MFAVGAYPLAIGKVRPHQLVLVHNDGHLAINPQQHQQVGRRKNVRKMELHGSPKRKRKDDANNSCLQAAGYENTMLRQYEIVRTNLLSQCRKVNFIGSTEKNSEQKTKYNALHAYPCKNPSFLCSWLLRDRRLFTHVSAVPWRCLFFPGLSPSGHINNP